MAVFNTYDGALETERKVFIQTLYQDKKGGQMIRLRIDEKGVASQISTCDMAELAATGTDLASYYTTVHTFRGWKRAADKVFNYTSIFVDLDCHAEDPKKVQEAKDRTVQLLEAAYEAGELCIPTMITDSGRGFGIQYVLKNSIAKIWKTEKSQEFYKKVRKCIFEKYEEILSADPQAAQADPAVLEDARVCRLPGTYNAKAGKYCRLISVSGKYYELSELVQGCKLWSWKPEEEFRKEKEKRKAKIASGKTVSFNDYKMPFLSARLEQLEKLQDLRGKDCAGCREQMLFIAYSTLVQIDHDTAAERLQDINQRFANPLDKTELDHIIEETDSSVGVDHRGYYKLKNDYLIDRLNLSDEEIKAIGLGMGWKRTAERQAARNKKKEVHEKIIELLKQVDLLTYQEISETVGVSRRKVCAIAKAEGLMRYAKAASRPQKEEKTDKIISIDTVREAHGQTDESAKIATKSVYVPLPTTQRTLLSTPVERGTGGEETDWYSWLEQLSSGSALAKELIEIYAWGTSFRFSVPDLEEFFDEQMPFITKHPDRLPDMLKKTCRKFLNCHGLDECLMILSMYTLNSPILEELCKQVSEKEEQHKYGRKKKKLPAVDLNTETPEQRDARIDRHLSRYKDQRFDIIGRTEEYVRRLDPTVLKEFKIVCMQVMRLKREFFWIEREKISTAEIKQCFDLLTYKDIVIICERMAHQGTIQEAEKPFFYIVQSVWKYKHPDAAMAQEERLHADKAVEKSNNSFCNFEQRTYDFDFGKFMEVNSMREITGQPQLTKEEFEKMEKEGII